MHKPIEMPHVTRVDCGGQPAVAIQGRPRFLSAPYLPKTRHESFAETGTEIWLLRDGPFCVGPDGVPDISAVERLMQELLDRDPQALAIVRASPRVPDGWLEEHPDDGMRFDHDPANFPGYATYRDASWGSEAWLDALCGGYGAFCAQLHRRFEGRVIGHQFGMGTSAENNRMGACAPFCADFSPAMQRYFRRWLRKVYEDDSALQAAWGRDDVTLDTAEVPERLERLRTEWFSFRSPLRRQAADYLRGFAERVEDIVIRLCETVKDATGGHCLAGSHLGAFMDNGFHGYLHNQTAINMTRRALAHPAVDLFTSPPSYINRQPGGDATSMMAVGSLGLHGKVIFQDQDTRTSVLPPGYRETFTLGPIAADLAETEGVLKRDAGMAILRGYGLWWHAMVRGMYDHPAIGRCIARLNAIGRRSMDFPRGVAEAGVAMIVDEESAFHQECANRLLYPLLYAQRQREWGRTGVPWNVFLHNDLDHPRMPDHPVYYFLNTFSLSDAEIRRIEHKVKRDGATLIWSLAPGIQSPTTGFDLARVERLTGFRVRAAEVEALPRVAITNFEHPYARDIPPPGGDPYLQGNRPSAYFGVGPMGNDEHGSAIGPLFYVDDPEAVTIGVLEALQEPGFCVKPMDGWTSVFVSAPMLNALVLRNIARCAGVHVYSESDDVVLPGKSFLTVHARSAGEKHIVLPEPRDVYECYEQREIGRGVTEFRDTLARHATGLYFLDRRNE